MSKPSIDTLTAHDSARAEQPDHEYAGNRFEFVVPGSSGPSINIDWRFWRRPKVAVNGEELPHRGRLRWRRELVTLADGTNAELRVAGFLNRSVVVNGQRYPLERRLRSWEYVLVGLPLLVMIPGPNGVGAIPVLLGLGGTRINGLLARSSLRRSSRIAAMIGVFVSAAAIAFTLGVLGVLVLGGDDSITTPTTWPYQPGDCLAGPADADLEQLHTVSCSSPHLGEVVGIPRDPVSKYPGQETLNRFADQHCGTVFADYVGRPFDDTKDGYLWFTPNAPEFKAMHGAVLCVGTAADDSQLTGTLAQQNRGTS